MAYDNVCKYLAETYPEAFAAWLLGKPLPLTSLEPKELTSEPIRADSLIFLQAASVILHIEFQTQPERTMPLRMLDYWLRLHKKDPSRTIHQTVIYLRPTQSELVQQTTYRVGTTQHEFNVIRLWDVEPESLKPYPGLLPLRPLCKSNDPAALLRAVQAEIEQLPEDRTARANLTAAVATLAGLRLEQAVIQQVLRSTLMRESTMVQAWLQEGREEGEARGEARGEERGREEGKQLAMREVAQKAVQAGMSYDQVAALTGLSLAAIEALGAE